MATKKYDLQELTAMRMEWHHIDTDALGLKAREIYLRRVKAVDMYIDGLKTRDIQACTGYRSHEQFRFVEKALRRDRDGNQFGYAALIPNRNTAGYERTKNAQGGEALTGTGSGMFARLLERVPDLEDFLKGNYFNNRDVTIQRNIGLRDLHQKMLTKLRESGIKENEYPFNTENEGYNAMRQYLIDIENTDIVLAAKRQGKDARQKLMSTGYGEFLSFRYLIPYQIVQIDGHRLDIQYTVVVKDKDGLERNMVAVRPWVLAVVDVSGRAILGKYVTQHEEYDEFDVLKAIQNALLPKKRMNFTLNSLKYPEDGGYPDLAHPELRYALFDTLMLDNAKAHLAENTLTQIKEAIGCNITFGSVATPETRAICERAFQKYEEGLIHRLPMTTGSSPSDLRGDYTAKSAVKYKVTYDDIEQLVEWATIEINSSRNIALDNLTPMQAIEYKTVEQGIIPCIADRDRIKKIEELHYLKKIRTVRGKLEGGKRPYIQYENAEYRGTTISSVAGYIGQKVRLNINPDDISKIAIYKEDGTFIEEVRATGRWAGKHTLSARQEAMKWARKNGKVNDPFMPPIDGLLKDLEARAAKDKRKRTKADILKKENDIPSLKEETNTSEIYEGGVSGRKRRKKDQNETPGGSPSKEEFEDFLKKLKDSEDTQEFFEQHWKEF